MNKKLRSHSMHGRLTFETTNSGGPQTCEAGVPSLSHIYSYPNAKSRLQAQTVLFDACDAMGCRCRHPRHASFKVIQAAQHRSLAKAHGPRRNLAPEGTHVFDCPCSSRALNRYHKFLQLHLSCGCHPLVLFSNQQSTKAQACSCWRLTNNSSYQLSLLQIYHLTAKASRQ